MKTSRQRLLEYIQAQRAVTVVDISRALKMTPANARHHLTILVEQGLVAGVGSRPAEGKGRPAQLYGLSEAVSGHNLDGLAAALLDEFGAGLAGEAQQDFLKRLAQRIGGPGDGRGGHLTRRLTTAVKFLNERKYQARWEAHTEAPRLILAHCPYAALLPNHPELCRLDAALLEVLLGVPVVQTAQRCRDAHGAVYCAFAVHS